MSETSGLDCVLTVLIASLMIICIGVWPALNFQPACYQMSGFWLFRDIWQAKVCDVAKLVHCYNSWATNC